MLSCICFGIGEALIAAALFGTAGVGAHAVTCATSKNPAQAATCCGHDHKPGSGSEYDPNYEPGLFERQGAPGMSRATRGTAIIALLSLAALLFATCAGPSVPTDHDSDEPCGTEHGGHDHDHG